MKLRFAILLLSIFSFSTLSAQWGGFGGKKGKTIKGTIKGELIDSTTNQPISYATLSLHKAGKEKIIDGILSEEDGSFKFSEVVNGKYDIKISFLGYADKVLKDVEVTLKKPTKNLKGVLLAGDGVMLDEVQVVEKRALIENKVDKIVFNAEDDASTMGGDATDVLRKVPMLAVDLDGNVSIRGSQQIRILINGKPSGMFSTNTAEALKMFPADQIKKVEVITQPGAKYDGEGSGGIINIITKGKDVEGVAGSMNASVGTRQNNGNVNLNVGRGRFGFTTNWGLYYSLPNDADLSFSRVAGGRTIYDYSGITNSSRLGFNGSASAFYDFNAYNALNTSFTYRGFGFDQDSDATGAFGPMSFSRLNDGSNLYAGYDWNTDFTKKFPDNDKQELTFAVQLSGNDQNQENFLTESFVDQVLPDRNEEINNFGDNVEITGQVDYVHPVGSSKLEIGAKSVIRVIDSDTRFIVHQDPNDDGVIDDLRSNIFNYDQDVYATYASYNFFFKKLNFITGLRYERTEIGGEGEFAGSTFTNSYDNFLPNIAVSKSLKNFRNLKLSYSKRIQRPSLRFINPFRNTSDFGNISFGDPTLRPELTDQFELGYNTNILGASIFATGYYKITSEIIESIVQVNANDISETTFSNVGQNKSVGVNLFITKSVGKLTMRLGGDIGTYNATGIVGGKELSNKALNYRIFTSGEYSISGDFKADYFGIFSAPRYTLQGKNPSFSMIGIGMRKDFKNKMSLGIRIIEPFEEFKNFDTEIEGDGFTQTSRFAIPFRSFGISFSYKFGKVDFKERRSKIKNTDQKQGEGGAGQGGQQQGGQRGN